MLTSLFALQVKANSQFGVCFKTEAEYKELLVQHKLPQILQNLPIYLNGESFIKGKAVISINFIGGFVKFYVNASTIVGDFKVTTSGENRVTVCVQEPKIRISFTKGPAQEAQIKTDNKINVKGLELEIVKKTAFDKLNLDITERVEKNEKVKTQSEDSGVN